MKAITGRFEMQRLELSERASRRRSDLRLHEPALREAEERGARDDEVIQYLHTHERECFRERSGQGT